MNSTLNTEVPGGEASQPKRACVTICQGNSSARNVLQDYMFSDSSVRLVKGNSIEKLFCVDMKRVTL